MEIISCNPKLNFTARKIPTKQIEFLTAKLSDSKVETIDIFCHACPDEDTINAAKVMYNWLKNMGKKVRICTDSDDTKDLYFNKTKYKLKKGHCLSDLALVVDFNSSERVPHQFSRILSKYSPENIIGFDHHNKNQTSINSNIYIDTTAHSCNSILVRFFEALNIKPAKNDLKSIFCGMVSDYIKSSYITVDKVKNKYVINKTQAFLKDKNSLEIFDKISNSLSPAEKNEILKHLDVLSNLTPAEQVLQKFVSSNIKLSPNKKLAYVVIPPNNDAWTKSGMDTPITSAIMKDFRVKSLSDKRYKNLNTTITFYRPSANDNEYKMSITSKNNQALILINKAMGKNPQIQGGGHSDRAGCSINSLKKEDINKFISTIVDTFEQIN